MGTPGVGLQNWNLLSLLGNCSNIWTLSTLTLEHGPSACKGSARTDVFTLHVCNGLTSRHTLKSCQECGTAMLMHFLWLLHSPWSTFQMCKNEYISHRTVKYLTKFFCQNFNEHLYQKGRIWLQCGLNVGSVWINIITGCDTDSGEVGFPSVISGWCVRMLNLKTSTLTKTYSQRQR